MAADCVDKGTLTCIICMHLGRLSWSMFVCFAVACRVRIVYMCMASYTNSSCWYVGSLASLKRNNAAAADVPADGFKV